MIEGKTKSGFKFKVDERLKDDWRIIEAIVDSESDDASLKLKGTKTLVDLVLGKDKQKMIDHISKKNDGYCSIESLSSEIADIFSAIKELKN